MKKEIYFAGGCFWGVEKFFSLVCGVKDTAVGYANGPKTRPSYQEVCSGSGHAETVRVRYETAEISLEELLELFFDIIDPTSVNRQGPDQGIQYRSGIYYTKEEDREKIQGALARLQTNYRQPLAVECLPLENFFPAEDEHQNYLKKHPGGYCHLPFSVFQTARQAGRQKSSGKGETTPLTPVSHRDDQRLRWRKKTVPELRRELTPLQYQVTQQEQTEPPFQNPYYDLFQPGIYVDITTGEPLFSSADKFESGCGWPSFSRPILQEVLTYRRDEKLPVLRTEVRSKTGDAHLGHVFDDGPADLGGRRFCINSAALRFIPQEKMTEEGYGDYLDFVKARKNY